MKDKCGEEVMVYEVTVGLFVKTDLLFVWFCCINFSYLFPGGKI